MALVIGGGSGHYPAFSGLVGPGLAHGAAVGHVFASPSAQQVYSVAKAAHCGGGVLLCYGNYAGDVLNFDRAQDMLRADGIECQTVVVTDDVASAPADQRSSRRGIAGDLAVFKAAGAAAEAGMSLPEVVRIARQANDRTRSFGVAFSGCTLPGAREPLFTVEPGMMAVGLGIHGEPGLGTQPIPSARDLARLLVDRLLEEADDAAAGVDGTRVAVILNGLGAVKYEELFLLYGSVHRRLRERGFEPIQPEVGEFCTSLDMAGVSLTLLWLTPELERLWGAPASSPAYRKGEMALTLPDEPAPTQTASDPQQPVVPQSSAESRASGQMILAALEAAEAAIDDACDHLGRLDAVAGDGDHGIGMSRGVKAAVAAARDAVEAGAGARTVLTRASDGWAARAGGTSGALWGAALGAFAARLDDRRPVEPQQVAEGVAAAVDAVRTAGGAVPGDKTMLDALHPFGERLGREVAAGVDVAEAWQRASIAAEQAAAATADLIARRGRARTHEARSKGTPDPGAVSFALIVKAMGSVFGPGA